MIEDSRRTALVKIGMSAALPLLATTPATAEKSAPPARITPAFAAQHTPVPLRFDPAKLDGLSERLIKSHWENNYIGSVKALNMIEGQIAKALADPDLPALVHGGLKRELSHRTGSVVLHELYFEQFGGDGKAGGSVLGAVDTAFGSHANWELDFRRTAMSLAGGSGWCVLALNLHLGSLENYWAWDHTNNPAMGIPLLALDMYEHSFQMDYGASAAKYVDAWFRNIDWAIVDSRFAIAQKMRAI
jgi:superoxide dismutase, Fe-Mn family